MHGRRGKKWQKSQSSLSTDTITYNISGIYFLAKYVKSTLSSIFFRTKQFLECSQNRMNSKEAIYYVRTVEVLFMFRRNESLQILIFLLVENRLIAISFTFEEEQEHFWVNRKMAMVCNIHTVSFTCCI